MRAKKSKWCEGERIPLADVVPLDTPISLMVESANACNFRCHYCYLSALEKQNNNKRFNTIMSFNSFEKLIIDAKQFPQRIKTVIFARYGEPLINPKLPEMIGLAKRAQVCQLTKVITNASLLRPELNYKLLHAGLDVLRISIQGLTEQQIYETCGYKINFAEFLENIAHFYKYRGNCKVFIKILDKLVESKDEEKKFFNIFGDICDEIAIEHLIDIENEDLAKKQDYVINMMGEFGQSVDVCSSPFYSLNICANGNISPCCADVKEDIVFGNIEHDSIYDIWNSKKLNLFRIMHLKKQRYSHAVCGPCLTPSYAKQTNDSIDNCREELLVHYADLFSAKV